MKKIPILALTTAVTSMVLLTGCANPSVDTKKTNSPTTETSTAIQKASCNTELNALLPAKLQQSPGLNVATNAPFPPYEMFAAPGSDELIGLEIELGTAIGETLCVPFKFSQQPYDGLIPGLEAKKYDVLMATMFATEERAKTVRFVNYAKSGSAIMVKKGQQGIKTLADLCGKRAAVQNGSHQAVILDKQSGSCETPITVVQFPQFSDERLAINSGKVDAIFGDLPALVTAAGEDPGLEVLTDPAAPGGYENQEIGIGVSKDQPELQNAILKAVLELQENGIYDQIFAKWNLSESALKPAVADKFSGQ